MMLIVIVLVIAFAGIISNQYSGLRKMDSIQISLDDLNQKLREMKQQK